MVVNFRKIKSLLDSYNLKKIHCPQIASDPKQVI